MLSVYGSRSGNSWATAMTTPSSAAPSAPDASGSPQADATRASTKRAAVTRTFAVRYLGTTELCSTDMLITYPVANATSSGSGDVARDRLPQTPQHSPAPRRPEPLRVSHSQELGFLRTRSPQE